MEKLTGLRRRELRAEAHNLKAVATYGKKGLSDSFLAQLEIEINKGEVIKVKFLEEKKKKEDIAKTIENRFNCECVGFIGNNAIFYKEI